MARRVSGPRWLSRVAVDAIQNDQLREHGGLSGVRDESVLESALARPQQQWHFSKHTDMATLAAAYGFGLVKNHPYRDGNKRIGFLAMITFLGMNGHDLRATDAEVVTELVALADGRVSEEELADWIQRHCTKRKDAAAVRSVVGSVDLPHDDEDLSGTDAYVRGVFDRSLARPMMVRGRPPARKAKRRG